MLIASRQEITGQPSVLAMAVEALEVMGQVGSKQGVTIKPVLRIGQL